MICMKPLVDILRAQSIFVVHRCCKSAGSSRGDADGWSHHEEVGSLSEDHPTLLCGHADHFHPPLHPPFLHGLSHTEGLRGQLSPEWTVWVREMSGIYSKLRFLCEQHGYWKG